MDYSPRRKASEVITWATNLKHNFGEGDARKMSSARVVLILLWFLNASGTRFLEPRLILCIWRFWHLICIRLGSIHLSSCRSSICLKIKAKFNRAQLNSTHQQHRRVLEAIKVSISIQVRLFFDFLARKITISCSFNEWFKMFFSFWHYYGATWEFSVLWICNLTTFGVFFVFNLSVDIVSFALDSL